MSGKGGSSLGTLLFSVPLAAIPLMAIFGIPQFGPLVAAPEKSDGYERSPDDPHTEDRSYNRRATDVLRSRGFETDRGRDAARGEFSDRRDAIEREHDDRYEKLADRRERGPATLSSPFPEDDRDAPRSSPRSGDDAPLFYNDDRGPERPPEAISDRQADSDAAPAATGLTWQTAAQHLQDLGITSYHLEPGSDAGSFLFVCSFCSAAGSNVTMRFEAEAVEPLDAVDDVLAQIDRWEQQQQTR